MTSLALSYEGIQEEPKVHFASSFAISGVRGTLLSKVCFLFWTLRLNSSRKPENLESDVILLPVSQLYFLLKVRCEFSAIQLCYQRSWNTCSKSSGVSSTQNLKRSKTICNSVLWPEHSEASSIQLKMLIKTLLSQFFFLTCEKDLHSFIWIYNLKQVNFRALWKHYQFSEHSSQVISYPISLILQMEKLCYWGVTEPAWSHGVRLAEMGLEKFSSSQS